MLLPQDLIDEPMLDVDATGDSTLQIKENAIDPRKERTPPIVLPNLCDHLRECAEDKVFRIRRILRNLERGGQQPIAQFGHKPLRSAFTIKRNLFPDLHSVFMLDAGCEKMVGLIFPG